MRPPRYYLVAATAILGFLSAGCTEPPPPDLLSDELRFSHYFKDGYSAYYERDELDSSTPGQGQIFLKINGDRIVRVSELTPSDIPAELQTGIDTHTIRQLPCTRIWLGDSRIVCYFHEDELIRASIYATSEHGILCDQEGKRPIELPMKAAALRTRLGEGNFVVVE